MLPFSSRFFSSLLKVFFYLLYHPFAWAYDLVAALVSLGKWKDWVLVAGRYVYLFPVLELGHGPGHLQIELAKSGELVYGLDASWQMSLQARRKLTQAGFPVRLVNSKSQALPFFDDTFATIVATFPTEYIVDPKTLKEIWRILMPGGLLVVLPLAWITGTSLFERWAAWLFQLTKQSPRKAPLRSEANDLDCFFDRSGRSLLQRFQENGFLTDVQVVSLSSSELMIILAEKPFGNQHQKIANQDS